MSNCAIQRVSVMVMLTGGNPMHDRMFSDREINLLTGTALRDEGMVRVTGLRALWRAPFFHGFVAAEPGILGTYDVAGQFTGLTDQYGQVWVGRCALPSDLLRHFARNGRDVMPILRLLARGEVRFGHHDLRQRICEPLALRSLYFYSRDTLFAAMQDESLVAREPRPARPRAPQVVPTTTTSANTSSRTKQARAKKS